MSRRIFRHIGFAALVASAWTSVGPAHGAAKGDPFSADLSGFEEVGGLGASQTGAILSNGTGSLSLEVFADSINYTLTYSNTTSTVAQAHIHFGKIHVAGGIMVFLCTNLNNGPVGTPACPPNGSVSGTLTAARVVGPALQNITPGNFGAVLAALESNTAYVNIHTANFPAGELRGQVEAGKKDKTN